MIYPSYDQASYDVREVRRDEAYELRRYHRVGDGRWDDLIARTTSEQALEAAIRLLTDGLL